MGAVHKVPLMDVQRLQQHGTHLTTREQTASQRKIVHRPVESFDLEWFADRYLPVRESANYRQRRNFIGMLWMSKLGKLRAYESLVERAVLLELDRDPNVRRVWSQPFRVDGLDPNRGDRYVWPTPDLLIEHHDSSLEVAEVKPSNRIVHPNIDDFTHDYASYDKARSSWQRLQHKMEFLETQLTPLSMTVTLRCEPSATVRQNLEYLSLYRRPLPKHDPLPERVMEHAGDRPFELMDLAEGVDGFVSTMPVILHLVWHRRLEMDLDQRIGPDTVVRAPSMAVAA